MLAKELHFGINVLLKSCFTTTTASDSNNVILLPAHLCVCFWTTNFTNEQSLMIWLLPLLACNDVEGYVDAVKLRRACSHFTTHKQERDSGSVSVCDRMCADMLPVSLYVILAGVHKRFLTFQWRASCSDFSSRSAHSTQHHYSLVVAAMMLHAVSFHLP